MISFWLLPAEDQGPLGWLLPARQVQRAQAQKLRKCLNLFQTETNKEMKKERKKERTVITHKEPQGYGLVIKKQKPCQIPKLSRGRPGHNAGLKEGGAILMINGQPCKNSTQRRCGRCYRQVDVTLPTKEW